MKGIIYRKFETCMPHYLRLPKSIRRSEQKRLRKVELTLALREFWQEMQASREEIREVDAAFDLYMDALLRAEIADYLEKQRELEYSSYDEDWDDRYSDYDYDYDEDWDDRYSDYDYDYDYDYATDPLYSSD